MNDKFKIYALVCPLFKKIRYIGKSTNYKTRYKQHCNDLGDETYKKLWITNLNKKNLLPEIIILDSAPTEIEARQKENFYCEKHINTIYNIFMPNKNAPTVQDYRSINNIIFDCEFENMKMKVDKFNKIKQ